MWFIGVAVEQETSAPLLKKILDPPLISVFSDSFMYGRRTGTFYDAALRCFGEMVEVRQNCVHQSGRFAFSKIQNSTFSKLCPPSKGKLLMGNFSERLTQNEIYFPNFHQYMQSQK